MAPRSIVIVGAGLAGARCAETLRAEGYDGAVTLVGDEQLPPYERPALSKEYLAGRKEEHELLLRPQAAWAEQQIVLRLGQRVVHVDPARRRAVTDTGSELGWDVLVLATGARPRRLPFAVPSGVHVLRTVEDARALRGALVPGAHLVVVGGGFVGAEVASTATALGARVTMLEALATPFERTLGPTLGRLLADRYRAHGVEMRVRTGVTGFGADAAGSVRSARLTDGSEIRCDVALVGIGVEPATELVPAPRRGRADPRVRRRDRGPRPLDERCSGGDCGSTSHPRPGAAAAAAGVLLVGPVRSPAPARRACRRHGGRRDRGWRRGLPRTLRRRRGQPRRSARRQPARRRRAPAPAASARRVAANSSPNAIRGTDSLLPDHVSASISAAAATSASSTSARPAKASSNASTQRVATAM